MTSVDFLRKLSFRPEPALPATEGQAEWRNPLFARWETSPPPSQIDPNSRFSGPVQKFRPSLLDLQSNPCNNYSVHQDGFGGVSVWQRYDFKRVNPSRTLCAVSSVRCNRKTLSRRSSATPFT